MSDCKAMILGLKGHALNDEEAAFFRGEAPWGFILFARNLSEPAQISDLVDSLRDTVGGRNAPVLIDQEGGRVQRLRPPLAPNYPAAAVLGALYGADREIGKRAAWLMSRLHAFDLMRYGINVDCLPVLDVPVAGSHNVIGDRAYGTEPEIVSIMGLEAAAGLKAGGVLPVIKHMPGHGRGMADSHHDLPVVTAGRAELEAHDFIPFQAARHELMAMSAHIVFTALDADNPATTSRYVIEEIIRGHIGFDGLLMSDDISMNALKGTIAERARAIVAGGCDMVLHCHGHMDEMQDVAAAVPVLAGKSLKRARAVEAALGFRDDAVEAAIRAEFEALLATA